MPERSEKTSGSGEVVAVRKISFADSPASSRPGGVPQGAPLSSRPKATGSNPPPAVEDLGDDSDEFDIDTPPEEEVPEIQAPQKPASPSTGKISRAEASEESQEPSQLQRLADSTQLVAKSVKDRENREKILVLEMSQARKERKEGKAPTDAEALAGIEKDLDFLNDSVRTVSPKFDGSTPEEIHQETQEAMEEFSKEQALPIMSGRTMITPFPSPEQARDVFKEAEEEARHPRVLVRATHEPEVVPFPSFTQEYGADDLAEEEVSVSRRFKMENFKFVDPPRTRYLAESLDPLQRSEINASFLVTDQHSPAFYTLMNILHPNRVFTIRFRMLSLGDVYYQIFERFIQYNFVRNLGFKLDLSLHMKFFEKEKEHHILLMDKLLNYKGTSYFVLVDGVLEEDGEVDVHRLLLVNVGHIFNI